MPKPPVIAIVVSWNGKSDTLECLESLRQSDYPMLQVVLVDNASSDRTPEAVRESYPETLVIRNEENLLFSRGVNIGISCALEMGGKFLFLLNNDATVHPQCISNLVLSIEKDSSIGLAGPKIFYFGTKRIWSAGGKVRLWAGTTSHIGIRRMDSQKYGKEAFVDYLTACALMIKSEVAEKIGMFDDSYFIYGEDADFSLRARKAGFKLLFVPQAQAWHRISSSSGGGLTPFKAYNRGKSGILLFKKHGKWYHFLSAPFFGILGLLLFTLKGVGSGELKNVAALWKGVFSGINVGLRPGKAGGNRAESGYWWERPTLTQPLPQRERGRNHAG